MARDIPQDGQGIGPQRQQARLAAANAGHNTALKLFRASAEVGPGDWTGHVDLAPGQRESRREVPLPAALALEKSKQGGTSLAARASAARVTTGEANARNTAVALQIIRGNEYGDVVAVNMGEWSDFRVSRNVASLTSDRSML